MAHPEARPKGSPQTEAPDDSPADFKFFCVPLSAAPDGPMKSKRLVIAFFSSKFSVAPSPPLSPLPLSADLGRNLGVPLAEASPSTCSSLQSVKAFFVPFAFTHPFFRADPNCETLHPRRPHNTVNGCVLACFPFRPSSLLLFVDILDHFPPSGSEGHVPPRASLPLPTVR